MTSKSVLCRNDSKVALQQYKTMVIDNREYEKRMSGSSSVYLTQAKQNLNNSRQAFVYTMGRAVQSCGVQAFARGTPNNDVYCKYLRTSAIVNPNDRNQITKNLQKFCTVR